MLYLLTVILTCGVTVLFMSLHYRVLNQNQKIATAKLLATLAHRGQKDKAGRPYIEHVTRVASNVSLKEEAVAWLHDAIEDEHFSYAELKECGVLSSHEIYCLRALDKKITTDCRYIRDISELAIARKVKIADIEDNLDFTRFNKVPYAVALTDKDYERFNKYETQLAILKSADKRLPKDR